MFPWNELKSPEQIAQATGKCLRRIQQLAQTLINNGLAGRIGKNVIYHQACIEFIKNLPDDRGKKTPVKDKIYQELVKAKVKHPVVFKGFSASTHETGWHYREFGAGQDVFMGNSYKEFLEWIKD